MDEKQEAAEAPQDEVKEPLTTDPSVLQAISFLETTVEQNIGVASDGRP